MTHINLFDTVKLTEDIHLLDGGLASSGTIGTILVYNAFTGKLFYNPDGAITGLGDGGHFVTLTYKPLDR